MSEDIINAEIIDGDDVNIVNEEIVESEEHGMHKLYIAGPMTGKEDFNHEMFHKVTREFRQVNFEVCNPAEYFDGDTTRPRKDYMRESVKYLLEADTIVLLPGWEESKGARLEAAIATELDLIIVEYVENEHEKTIVGEGSFTPVDENANLGSFVKVDAPPAE
jgi:hypothetical protein